MNADGLHEFGPDEFSARDEVLARLAAHVETLRWTVRHAGLPQVRAQPCHVETALHEPGHEG